MIKEHSSKEELIQSVTLMLPYTTLIQPANKLCPYEESTWIRFNESSLGLEECCIYYCKKGQNKNTVLSVVSLRAVIFVRFVSILLHFSNISISHF